MFQTYFAAILSSIILVLPIRAEEMPPTIKAIVEKDTWTLSEGTHNDKPLLIRFRSQLREKPDVTGYPNLLEVTWVFDGGETGMPSSKATEQMRVFEDRLVKAVESDFNAVLTAVITNDNKRIWLYYAKDVPTFSERLHKMPQEKTRYPITIEARDDKNWSYLHDKVFRGLKEQQE